MRAPAVLRLRHGRLKGPVPERGRVFPIRDWRLGLAGTAFAVAGLAAGMAVVGTGSALAAHRASPSAALFYLSLGGDDAAGAQPNAMGHNVATKAAFPDQLFTALHTASPRLRLVNLACPGEDTSSMIHGGVCTYQHGSQLAQAAAFLKSHQGHVQLVTVEIGATDLDPCLALKNPKKIPPCFAKVIPKAAQNLAKIMTRLRSATSTPVKIIGTAYGNPGVAIWLQGTKQARLLARDGVTLARGFANTLTSVYTKFGAGVANIFTAFHNGDFKDRVMLPPFGLIPLNVADACSYTWVCSPAPTRGNELPNQLGYAVMANTFLAAYLGPPAAG